MIPLRGGWEAGGFLGSGRRDLREKRVPVPLRAFEAERDDVSAWIKSCMLLG